MKPFLKTAFVTGSLSVCVAAFCSQAPAGTPTSTPEPIRGLITAFYQGILGRDPEPGGVDAWRHGYFDCALSFGIDVRFIPREIGQRQSSFRCIHVPSRTAAHAANLLYAEAGNG
jgi:hypothetical protein